MRFFHTSFLFCSFILSCFFALGQTTLSGIINKYSKVTAINTMQNMVTVADLAGFKVCDTVLLIQMQGAEINRTNNSNYGSIRNYNSAGLYEKAIIYNIVGNNIFFRNQLLNIYNPNFSLQLVSIPQFSKVTISGTLTGKTWDGSTGGIIAFEAADVIRITGSVTASGIGFRGGNTNSNAACSANLLTDYAYLSAQNSAAFKGEGIAIMVDSIAGRGNAANGGGAGSCKNGGGGGGANAGFGGLGGKGMQSLGGSSEVSGVGARIFAYNTSSTKIFLGGGGGGGHQDDNLGTSGGNGGGIIYISGKQIIGTGTINANGTSPTANAGIDGAGGGGAGGTIILNATTKSLKINLLAKGGVGGNNAGTNTNGTPNNDCFATGGGGGGGVILINGNTDEATVAVDGGEAGKILNATSTCTNTTYGATSGTLGQVLNNANIMPFSNTSATNLTATITTTAVACGTATQILTANLISGASYQWQFNKANISGETNASFTVSVSGVYRVSISIGCHTVFSEEVTVTVASKPAAIILGNSSIELCKNSGNNPTLNAAKGVDYTYQWLKDGVNIAGATNNMLNNIIETGKYTVNVTACGVAATSNEITVFNPFFPAITVTGKNTICQNTSITLSAFPKGYVYQWYKNGVILANAVGETYEATTIGTYKAAIVSNCETTSSNNFIITSVTGLSEAIITGSKTVCSEKTTVLRATIGTGLSYQWLFNGQVINNATQNNYIANQIGTYNVRIEDACLNALTSAPFILSFPTAPNNITVSGGNYLCNGQARISSVNRKNPTYTYQWFLDGLIIANATDTTYLATKLGRYSLQVTDTCGTTFNTPNWFVIPNLVTNIDLKAENDRLILCPNETVTLIATPSFVLADLQWQFNNVDIPNEITIILKVKAPGVYRVRTRYECNNVFSAPITLSSATPPPATITGNPVFCFGDKTILTANAGQNLQYQWYKDGAIFPNAITQTLPVFFVGKYQVLVTNAQGCGTLSEEVVVSSSRINEANVRITESKLICSGEQVQLLATGGTRYEWSPRTGLNNAFVPNPIAKPTESTIYKVKISNSFGCFVERFVNIDVVPEFSLDFDLDYTVECGRKSYVQIVNKSQGLQGFNDIKWDMGNGEIITGLSPIPYLYNKGGNYTITLTVTNRTCTKTMSKALSIESLFTSNIITPNNDGKNDRFIIDNPNENWKLVITNRYGKTVFESENYNNEWAGDSNNTLYFYTLTTPLGKQCSGWVQVLQ